MEKGLLPLTQLSRGRYLWLSELKDRGGKN